MIMNVLTVLAILAIGYFIYSLFYFLKMFGDLEDDK
jgi:carbon starvation protein CstA